jgi:hypothetical protein
MATITIIGATLITAIAIGKTYRLVAASKLEIRVRARAAAHAAAFSLSAVSEATRHFGRGRAANPNPAGGDEMRKSPGAPSSDNAQVDFIWISPIPRHPFFG